MQFFRFVPAAPLALLAACASTPEPPPPAPPAPLPTPTPTPTPPPAPVYSNWEAAPLTPGDWSYAAGTATFGQPGRALLTLTCERGAIGFAVAGTSGGPITIRTETTTRAFAGTSLPARDPLLDAIAFSKGRFALEAPGVALYVPSYPEISRVIEDCR